MNLPYNGCVTFNDPSDPSFIPAKQPKFCRVCGDRAKSYHFGGLSCDSCKAFFRRSVQSAGYKNFQCPYRRTCEITISSRKCCQFCRFQKCVNIGMEKGWVMTEEERLHVLKIRTAKRQQEEETNQGRRKIRRESYHADLNDIHKFLTEDDIHCIESIMNSYGTSCLSVPFDSSLSSRACGRNRTEIIDMFFTVIKQFANFAQQLRSFAVIPPHDQEILLRTGVMELCFLRGAYVFDETRGAWPDQEKMFYKISPTLSAEDVRRLVSAELFDKHMGFIRGIKEIDIDEPTLMILLVTVLMSSDRAGLVNVSLVAKEQEKYCVLLKNYMLWRYGSRKAMVLYPKLFLKLPNLRELTEAHSDYHLRLNMGELEEIERRLSCLRIESPTPGCSTSKLFQRNLVTNRRWSLRGNLSIDSGSSSTLSLEEESSSSEGSGGFPWTSEKENEAD
ncbi:thyroid hormone receptor beta-like [Limulus polyphemus]|uniref:Thyroid hormone receptor beta-like n=1 Tax=Limulus polyphemus TaxID=6850 RepID=A0ABM1TQ16_LIMPO|nr:thyroid hormone receptor beta-like [Limulus polyphemus]